MKSTDRTGFNLFPKDNDSGNSDDFFRGLLEADYVEKLQPSGKEEDDVKCRCKN